LTIKENDYWYTCRPMSILRSVFFNDTYYETSVQWLRFRDTRGFYHQVIIRSGCRFTSHNQVYRYKPSNRISKFYFYIQIDISQFGLWLTYRNSWKIWLNPRDATFHPVDTFAKSVCNISASMLRKVNKEWGI